MNIPEAKAVVIAANEADGGCHHCAGQVLAKLEKLMPEIPWEELDEQFQEVEWKPAELDAWAAR